MLILVQEGALKTKQVRWEAVQHRDLSLRKEGLLRLRAAWAGFRARSRGVFQAKEIGWYITRKCKMISVTGSRERVGPSEGRKISQHQTMQDLLG